MMHVQLSPREKKILSLSLAVLAVYLVKTLVVAPVQTSSEGLDR